MASFRAFPQFRSGLLAAGLFAFAAPFMSGPGLAAEVIGEAERVENAVFGEIPGSRRRLASDDDVHLNELVRTEAASAARLRFADGSDLRLGPSAQIRLDAFVFSGKPNAAMNLARGAMRFVSGSGPAGSYQIRTPVATIGLRGTGVDVVLNRGRVFVTLLSGAARVCIGTRCADLVNRCDYVEAGAGQVQPARPLVTNVPTFSDLCQGAACGGPICTAASAAPGPAGRGSGAPPQGGGQPRGYDPASGGNSDGAGGASGGGSGGRGK